ncbi:glycosyltransferase 87 family protein [Streptomyces noursei]|uniref:glycosyltransferase 87 family protein n=1 Tax=Streptomyces noursei TaxID=1971 RepID=UPI00344F5496
MKHQLACKSTNLGQCGRLGWGLRTPRRTGGGPRRSTCREAWGWSACAIAALGLALFTTLPPHRTWSLSAAVGYGCAAMTAARLAKRRRPSRSAVFPHELSLILAVMGSVVVPLLLLVWDSSAQLEVAVVERSGDLLLHSGSPYIPAPTTVGDYNPYLPGMAVFGLPHALFGGGPLTDARWWMAGAFFVTMAAATRTLFRRGRGVAGGRPGAPTAPRFATAPVLLWLAACPLVALPLAVGGIDLPVIGLMCWGLAAAANGTPGRAGLLIGAAAALKWTAWPAAPVVLALVAARHGRRSALAAAAATALTVLTAVVPFLLTAPRAFVENVLAFPLGLGSATSPAASPLPGWLLATYVPGGAIIAMVLLAVAAIGVAGSLAIRPPRTVRAAADRLAIGLALAMALMPATRFGYLVYPLVLWAWPRLMQVATATGPRSAICRRSLDHASLSEVVLGDLSEEIGPGVVPGPDQRQADGLRQGCGTGHVSVPQRVTEQADRKRRAPEVGEETML